MMLIIANNNHNNSKCPNIWKTIQIILIYSLFISEKIYTFLVKQSLLLYSFIYGKPTNKKQKKTNVVFSINK